MKDILSIQFRQSHTAQLQEQLCIDRSIGSYGRVQYINALVEDGQWSDPAALLDQYQAVILGGSGDLDFDGGRATDDVQQRRAYEVLERLSPLLTYIFARDIPTFGICFGHQLIGAWCGATVASDAQQKKTGTYELYKQPLAETDAVFSHIPSAIVAQYGHKDVLCCVPDGAVLLMCHPQHCQVAALRYQQNIYTVQFHPEIQAGDLIKRMAQVPDYLPEGVVAEDVIYESPHASTLLPIFVEQVIASQVGLSPETIRTVN